MSFSPLVEPVAALSESERARTVRHASLAGFGELGQRRLRAAHVAVVGAGGLGSPVLLALAAAGVGTLTVIDDDAVEASNLQRQVIHSLADVGQPKVDSAARRIAGLSPETEVRGRKTRIDAANARDLLAGADLVIDGSDTFDTREAVAAACEALGVPLVWGTVQEFAAQVTVFWTKPPAGTDPIRLGDLYPTGSVGFVPTCADVGVLGALCLQVGGLMSIEAIKLIAGIGEPLLGRVLVIDGLRARQREVPLRPAGMEASVPPAPSAAASTTPVAPVAHISPAELAAALAAGTAPTMIDVREQHQLAGGTVPGSHHLPLGAVLADPSAFAESVGGPVVVICQAGVRATRAARSLGSVGVEAIVLTGGMDAWATTQAETDLTAQLAEAGA
jgi:adenylyltransferase/sulfurtransferase